MTTLSPHPAWPWDRAHQVLIAMRYSDLDTMNHVNNATYLHYVETARVALNRETWQLEGHERSVVARIEVDYRREIKLGPPVTIRTLIERIGTTSWTLSSQVIALDQLCAFVRTVEVQVDATGRPQALSIQQKERLSRYLIDSSSLEQVL